MYKVLVTGGTGFVGRALRWYKPDWVYVGSDWDLTDYQQAYDLIRTQAPNAVVHLAARVGGIKANMSSPVDFYEQNLLINTNVVRACASLRVQRLLAALSTCAFPNVARDYPMSEEDMYLGPPAESNWGYAIAKRALHTQTRLYHENGLEYNCFCPSNVYGPTDDFHSENSHFIAAMLRRLHEAEDKAEFWGDGRPLRQHLFVRDLAQAIPLMLKKHLSPAPLIVTPNENLSIDDIIRLGKRTVGKPDLEIKYTGQHNGQHRKDCSNKLFTELFPDFKFTRLSEGLMETYRWYKYTLQ